MVWLRIFSADLPQINQKRAENPNRAFRISHSTWNFHSTEKKMGIHVELSPR